MVMPFASSDEIILEKQCILREAFTIDEYIFFRLTSSNIFKKIEIAKEQQTKKRIMS